MHVQQFEDWLTYRHSVKCAGGADAGAGLGGDVGGSADHRAAQIEPQWHQMMSSICTENEPFAGWITSCSGSWIVALAVGLISCLE